MQASLSVTIQPSSSSEIMGTTVKSTDATSNITSTQRRRRVHFGPSVVVQYHDRFQSDELNKNSLWWSKDEFETIMSRALHIAAEAKQHSLLSNALDQAVLYAGRLASSLNAQEEVSECLESISDEGRGLRLWCQYGHSRRGIEKYTSRVYHESRKCDTRRVVKQVVLLSKKNAPVELIRRTSESASRTSAILARMMGLADAKAATSQSPGGVNTKDVDTQTTPELMGLQRPTTATFRSKIVLKRAA